MIKRIIVIQDLKKTYANGLQALKSIQLTVQKGEFFARVRKAYLDLAAAYPDRIKIVDASKSLEDVQNQIVTHLDNLLS